MSAVDTVGWDAGLERPTLPALTADATADVCVVGLGASGLAAVEAALDRGLSVIAIDAGRVAAGAAGRNGGFLLGGPAPFPHDAQARWGDAAMALYRETLAELDRVADAMPDVVRRVGSIRLAGRPGSVDADELGDVRAHAASLRDHGIAFDHYDGPLGTGIYLPGDGAANPALRVVRTAARLAARGAHLHADTPATSVRSGEVRTPHGTVRTGAVVVAVDGKLSNVLPELAGRVRTTRLQMLATAPVAPVVDCPVYCRWGYDYLQQLPDGRVFAGGGRDHFVDDEWTNDTEPTADVQGYIESFVARLVPDPTITARWAASVGYTEDGRPLCVRVDDGVVGVGGYNGTGNLVGPVAARAALGYALDGTTPPAWLAS